MNVEQWQRQIRTARAQKDMFFASHSQSPLPHKASEDFSGFYYWAPNPVYYFEPALYEHTEKTVQDVQDTVGQSRNLMCWGEFRFEVDSGSCTLQVYKSNPDENRLFLPFRGQTSGKDSYDAGRYIDLEPSENQTRESAYNPWCAYSNAYACPSFPPNIGCV